MSKVRTFEEQYRIGYLGEEFLLGAHDWLNRAPDGERRFDLIDIRPPFPRVEVKTDAYPMGGTPNMYMERSTVIYTGNTQSSRVRRIIWGGPWRALEDKVDVLVYLFANGGTADAPSDPVGFWFRDVPALCERLDQLIAVRPRIARPSRVRNLKVTAQGYIVPREALLDRLPGVEEIRYQQRLRTEEPNADRN